jgi:SAM-dependent methyltransferase
MARYSRRFFLQQQEGSCQSARAILPIMFDLVSPRSVVDVGCGVAPWLAAARELGARDTVGIDGDYVDRNQLMVPQECFLTADLSMPITPSRKFDVAICVEVAEHLPASVSATFVRSLCGLSPVVLFSAAVPGQRGTHHINEQWPTYWEKLFNECGFELLDCIRWRVWDRPEVEFWYAQNCFLFVERDYLLASPRLAAERERTKDFPRCIVHPRLFARAQTLRSLFVRIPGGLKLAITRRTSHDRALTANLKQA